MIESKLDQNGALETNGGEHEINGKQDCAPSSDNVARWVRAPILQEQHEWMVATAILPEETARMYAAFMTFLHLGESRTLARAAQVAGLSEEYIRKLSCRHQWIRRAAAYDYESSLLREKLMQERQKEIVDQWAKRDEEARDAEWRQAQKLSDAANRILDRVLQSENLDKIRPFEAAKMLQVAAMLSRNARQVEKPQIEQATPPPVNRQEIDQKVARIYEQLMAQKNGDKKEGTASHDH